MARRPSIIDTPKKTSKQPTENVENTSSFGTIRSNAFLSFSKMAVHSGYFIFGLTP